MNPFCSWLVHILFTVISWLIHDLFMTCSWHDHNFHDILIAPNLFITFNYIFFATLWIHLNYFTYTSTLLHLLPSFPVLHLKCFTSFIWLELLISFKILHLNYFKSGLSLADQPQHVFPFSLNVSCRRVFLIIRLISLSRILHPCTKLLQLVDLVIFLDDILGKVIILLVLLQVHS